MELSNKERLKAALLLVALGARHGPRPPRHWPVLSRAGNQARRRGPILVALLVESLLSLWRGEVGLDIEAARQYAPVNVCPPGPWRYVAAAVFAVMYSGGTFLAISTEGRARREMRDLFKHAPPAATRHRDGALVPFAAARDPCRSRSKAHINLDASRRVAVVGLRIWC